MSRLEQTFGFLLTAFLWGGTNPFIKRGTNGLAEAQNYYSTKNFPMKQLGPLFYLLTRWQFIVPSLINFLGTVSFYWTLSKSADLGLAVPLANSLTFCLTFLTGYLLGEEVGGKMTWIGLIMVIIGIVICVDAKS